MDREGFKNRIKQYKEAKGFDPQLKYWDWKQKYDSAPQPDSMLSQPQPDQPTVASQPLDDRAHRWDNGYVNTNRESFDSPYEDARYYDYRKPRFEFRKGDVHYSNPKLLNVMGKFGKVIRGGSMLGEIVQNLFPSEEAELIEDLRVKMDKRNKQLTGQEDIPEYGGGTVEVRDNTYVAPIGREQEFIPATEATKLKHDVLRKITRGGQIKSGQVDIVSPEFDLLTGIRAVATLPTKAEKLGRTLTNSDFISDDKITDLINSKHINDLTTFAKKNKGDADWYVHTDLGKSSSVFAGKGKGAYIQDKKLHPGEALIFDQKPYVWWNHGDRYTNLGENKDGYQAIIINKNNAKDLLQVKSSQSPIGQWDGKRGFVLPSEYVTHRAVDLTPDIKHYVYDGLTKTYGNVKHYAEGGEVTGPPTYEQWNVDMNQYNPTILDNASMYWSIEAAKKALHKEAMKLPGYAERWAEYYRSLPKNDPDINQFVDDLWANENPNNVGYKNGKYYPHKSPEGGKMTIGPGFKLDSGSHGISTKTANRGMTKTRLDQEARKIGKQHLKAVDQFINYGQTTNPADTISPQIKMGLMDLRHQVGPLNEWSNLRQAVLNGDLEGIRKESTVIWNDNGKTKVDKRRKKIRDEKYFYYE